MKIEWNTDLYRIVRKNICKWSDANSDIFQIAYCDDFEQILEEHDAYIDYYCKSHSFDLVTDSLGMNENHYIMFNNPNKYLLFLLRWS